MNKIIDSGKIVYKKYFKKPQNTKEHEKNFDSQIRARALVEFLLFKRKKSYNKKKVSTLHYYVAHPIIREMVINKKNLNNFLDFKNFFSA